MNKPGAPEPGLYGELARFAAENPARLHMPGHKGRALYGDDAGLLAGAARLDFTELTRTGDLYGAKEPVSGLVRRIERVFSWPAAMLLTGGATQGITAAMSLACPVGSTVLCDRNTHGSVHNAMAILDLHPIYPETVINAEHMISAGPSLEDTERLLKKHAPAAVIITSPTYFGRVLDVAGFAALAHRYGAALVVDSAHGAHLGFMDGFRDAITCGADAAAFSFHKTLPALGGAAAVATCGTYSADTLRFNSAMFGSSSPAYTVMASCDLMTDWLSNGGRAALNKTADAVSALRARLRATGFYTAPEGARYDPLRLTITMPPGFDGNGAATLLEHENVYCEMSDSRHVVCIAAAGDEADTLPRLEHALLNIIPNIGRTDTHTISMSAPHTLKQALSPREALFSRSTQTISLGDACGMAAACQLAPYPPGVPIVAPGEIIERQHVLYLANRGIGLETAVRVIDITHSAK